MLDNPDDFRPDEDRLVLKKSFTDACRIVNGMKLYLICPTCNEDVIIKFKRVKGIFQWKITWEHRSDGYLNCGLWDYDTDDPELSRKWAEPGMLWNRIANGQFLLFEMTGCYISAEHAAALCANPVIVPGRRRRRHLGE